MNTPRAKPIKATNRKIFEEKDYKTGSKTVQIRFDKKVPTEEIRRMLQARAKINQANKPKI